MNSKIRQIDVFCDLLDDLYKDGHPTKAQLIDIFHKSNPASMDAHYVNLMSEKLHNDYINSFPKIEKYKINIPE